MIVANDLSIINNKNRTILTSLNFTIERGASVLLVGKNGIGKSTLFRTMLGIEKKYGGSLTIDNVEMTDYNQKDRVRIISGFLGQNYFNNLTLLDNLKLINIYTVNSSARIEEIIELFELGDMLDCYPKSLSSGQQQRLALAIAFFSMPTYLILDEPFNFLDFRTMEKMMVLIENLKKSYGVSFVISSHTMNINESYIDNVLLIKDEATIISMDKSNFLNLYLFDLENDTMLEGLTHDNKNFSLIRQRSSEGVQIFATDAHIQFAKMTKNCLNYRKCSLNEFLMYATN